jgi:predicted DNA-binding transcriptional regulator AlpA
MSESPLYLRPVQAATRVGLSTGRLAKMRLDPDSGGPSFFKLGRSVVYKISEIDAWVEARRRKSTKEPEVTAAG